VIKKSFGGYDGYGTYYSDRKDDLRKLQELLNADHVFIAEPKAKLSKELATVFVRDRWGNADHFPLVETIQQDSKCSIVIGPQHHKDFKKLSAVIFKMLKSINYVGCLGVEMFLINGKLVVNELAPRVHNTGHYTQDACQNSQFELHVRACAGMKLPKIKLIAKNFCMANLLGTQSAHVSIPADYQGSLHLYGKDLSQLGRKMGHINWVDTDSPAVLKSKAIKQRKFFKL
jgi:5-(carboxyamino)imidazole ribonucleotide synthase